MAGAESPVVRLAAVQGTEAQEGLTDISPALALAIERVVKARSLQSADVPADDLEALCRLKPILDGLGMHLAVTAR